MKSIMNYKEGKMKKIFLVLLSTTLFTIVISFCGYRLYAESGSNKDKKAIVKAKSLTGPMNNTKAGQGTNSSKSTATNVSITLDLSEDGASVAKITISIGEVKFEVKTSDFVSSGTSSGENQYLNGPFSIKNGIFKTTEGSGISLASGRFISPEKAEGSAHLYSFESVAGQSYKMDLGEWEWKATAK
jgi:hypothetical protein